MSENQEFDGKEKIAENSKKRKKAKKKRTAWNIISNVIVYSVLVIVVATVATIMITQSKNRIAYIFGYSIAVIQTGSMIDGGFDIGERVVIKRPNVKEIRVDDVIVFYKYQDNADINLLKTNISDTIDTYVPPEYDTAEKQALDDRRQKLTDDITKNTLLIFHRVTGIFVDEYGTLFYQTKGDSNATTDSILIRQDFVAGEYTPSSPFVTWLLEIMSSSWGILILLLIPLFLLTISQIKDLFKGIRGALRARKLINGDTYFRDKKYLNFEVDKFFEEEEKLYLYLMASQQDKPAMAVFLWKSQTNPEPQIQSEIMPEDLLECFKLSPKDKEGYWSFWKHRDYSNSFVKRVQLMEIVTDLVKIRNLSYTQALDQARVVYKKTRK